MNLINQSLHLKDPLKGEIILGVDPGSVITGYGFLQKTGQRMSALDYGCIRPPKNYKLSDRYLVIHEGIYSLIEKWRPDALSIETQYVSKNVQSAMKLGMARAAVMIASKRHGIPIFSYTPSKAKLAVTGSGSASKEQVQGMVKRLLSLATLPTPFDASDALSLAICHAHASKWAKEI